MAKLAINGGTAVFKDPLRVQWPHSDQKDIDAVSRVVASARWWRGGSIAEQAKSYCGKFERLFSRYHDSDSALCVTSGTVALETALRAAGVAAGDEVIVPTLSFVVSASAVLPMGAVAVFVDSLEKTLQMDPAAIEAAITPRTRAIIIVHFGGYPANLDKIAKIAARHKLPLIEDCAHSPGSQWRGRGVGSYGDYGTFSFQNSKSLTCGEGGIVLCKSREHWLRAYRYHHLGRLETQGSFDFHQISTNARMTDIQGALLLSQFSKYRRQRAKRQRAGQYLNEQLRQIGGLDPLPDDKRITRRGYYYYLLKYDSRQFKGLHRDEFRQALAAEGVAIGPGYGKAIHRYPLFQEMKLPRKYTLSQYRSIHLPVSERIAADVLCSVHHPLLLATRGQLSRFVEAVAKIKANVDELL